MKQWMMPANATTADELLFEDAAIPEPGDGEVRIRVDALSLNARDTLILAGPFGRLPGVDVVPMSDVAGTIDALGSGVTGWSVGDKVTRVHAPEWTDGLPVPFGVGAGSMDDQGAAAEYLVLPEDTLVAAPSNLDAAEASTLQVAGVTAWNALFEGKPIGADDKVLVLGSGGVALYALQLARAIGAEVYVGVRHGMDDPRWAELGAAGVVDTTSETWPSDVVRLSGGVTKVINSVGSGIINECLGALEGGGEVAVLGLYDQNPPQLDMMALIGKQASVRGVAVGSGKMHRDLTAFIEEHDIKPIIDRSYPFSSLADAFSEFGSHSVFGKVVITGKDN